MRCPNCAGAENRVLETRAINLGIRRRRQCQCGHRWATVEINADIVRDIWNFWQAALRPAKVKRANKRQAAQAKGLKAMSDL